VNDNIFFRGNSKGGSEETASCESKKVGLSSSKLLLFSRISVIEEGKMEAEFAYEPGPNSG